MRTERDLGAGRRCAPPETLACEGDRRASVSPRLDSLRYGVPGEIARAVPVVKPRELAGFAVFGAPAPVVDDAKGHGGAWVSRARRCPPSGTAEQAWRSRQ